MKTLLALTSGVVFLPALAGGAFAAPGAHGDAVHLVTEIRALSHAPGGLRYAVTVRPVGGAAHAATLVLSTRRPAAWTASAPGCLTSRDRTELACDLGDVREAEPRTLRLAGTSGGGPAEVPVVARAAAANAPSVTSSLGTSSLRVTHGGPGTRGKSAVQLTSAGGQGSPEPAARTSAAPEPSASAVGSPGVESPAVQSPAVQSPAVESPAAEAPEVQAQPESSPLAESPSAQPSGDDVPAVRAAASAGSPPKGAVRQARPTPASPAPSTPAGARGGVGAPGASLTPHPSHAPGAAQAMGVPIIPDAPIAPDLPGASAAVPPPLSAGGPVGPVPGASTQAALPQIAAHPPARGEGVSELSTLSPAGAMQAGRWSWATLIAVAIVTEAGLLWLVAGFTVWRRRRSRKDGRHRRVPSPWVLLSRLLP